MDSKSLMIGDWVHYIVYLHGRNNPPYEKDIQVKNIYGHEINCKTEDYQIVGGTFLIDCEPIPLTPEILEKNGFELDENCGYCIWLDEHLIAVNLETHNLAIESILIAEDIQMADIQIADNYIHIPALPIHDVHQLQHALRLCGLTDFAGNFKV